MAKGGKGKDKKGKKEKVGGRWGGKRGGNGWGGGRMPPSYNTRGS